MKILITGSNGLVGSNVSSFLQNKNSKYEIINSNRQDTDLFDFNKTKKLLNNVKPDVLVNCAAKVGGIVANNSRRTEFILDNLKINTNLLEASIDLNEIKIINLGSSCIYPLNAPNPIKENSFMNGVLEPTNSPYAMAKLTAIELGRAISSQYGHKIINLMPTNLYGPNDNYDPLNSHFFPSLIRKVHNLKNKKDKIQLIQNKALELSMFLSIPATIALMISSKEIVSALFGYGSFNEESVVNSAKALYFFAIGLPAFAFIKVFSSFFFANQDTKIPFYISLISVLLNIFISIYYFNKIGFIIIPIATSISSWFNAIVLFIIFNNFFII